MGHQLIVAGSILVEVGNDVLDRSERDTSVGCDFFRCKGCRHMDDDALSII